YNANTDNPIDTIYSDNLGAYNFAPVPIGNYYLVFNTSLLSSTYSISPQDAGFNDAVDSDIDSNTGQSVDFTILSGTTESSIDAGFIPLANIGDMVWADTSENGLFEFGEPGIEGVTVTLYDAATDMVVLVTMTDAFGQFNFIAPAGAYYLGFDVSTNTDGFTYNGTLQAVGADETIDSDADPITGLTDPFVFDPLGGHLSTIDAGFIIDCPAAEAGPNVSICENTQAQLFASGGTTYNWTPTTGLSDPAIANPAAMPNTTTTYFVEVSDVFGCMSTDSVTVTVLPVPSITSILPTNPSFCGGADGSLVISAAGGITPLQFSIDGGMNFQASNSFSNLVAGTYQVVVANDGGSCPSAPMMATLSDNVVVCTDIIVADTMVLAAVDAPDLCFRLPFSAIGDYEISIDGAVYTDPVVACTIDTMGVAASQISLPGRGVYEMILTNTTTCCRDTVAIAVLSTTSPDTLFTITPFESSTGLLCADTSELAGDFSSISSCSAPQNGSFTFDGSPCVDYTPAMGFVGNDTLCLAVCDDFGSCDTTVMFITVLPETCPDIITATSETINLSDCSAVGALCIDLSLAEISSYNITDNGSPYAGGIQACDFDTSYVYTFFTLPGMGLTGPYTLDNWEVNGTAFSGAIPDMNALLDSMNLWDPMGNWTIDMGSSSILGGITASNYSTMTITEDASGTSTVLQRNISLIPIDTRLSFTLGGHEVVFMDASTGCSDTLNVNVVCACPTLFSGPVEIEASNCNDLETYCTPIAFADIVNYSISDNGGAYTGGVTPCPSDPSFAAIRVDTGFHQLVFTQLSSPCSDTLDLRVNCQACPDILPDALTLDAVDCDTPVEFCFDISPDEIADYTITDNGDPYTGLYSTCSFDTIQTYITIGFNVVNNYTLDSWTVNGANFSTNFISTQQLVDSMNVWDPLGNWEVSGLIISGGVNGSVYGNIIVSLSGITTADAVPNPQLTPSATSMTLDTGFHAIVISNDITGCVEMIDVTVNCAPIVNCSPLFTSQSIETSTNNCEDLTSICLPAAIEDIIRYSITDNGVPYTEPLEGCDFDSLFTYAYLTLPGAGNTGPYNLDSWTVNGTMFSGGFMNIAALVDSMNIWDVSSTWVFDPVDLIISGANPNNIYSSMNITQVGTGAFTSLDLNLQIRANATQIDLSTGSHLLRFTDNTTGCVDSISIDVLCIGTDVWTDTLMLGMIDTICVDTTELPGNIVSISNACPELSGDFVVFDVIENSNCIEVNAIDVGVDTACIVVCDDGGLCDTTLLYFTVLTDTVPPVAIADIDSTMQGQTVVINIQTNDGGQNIDTLFISGFPSNGVATLNEADGTITYAPNEGYCDSNTPDSLTYVVCNSFGCDSTTVSIYVFCNTINVMTGFSPNRDGKNDFFVIEGLQAYPNNVLNIYSRWGNLVYRKEGYLNDWDATWESTDLPDGTYFYVLSDGEGGVYSGYVQIHR
ncbi:MAG: SdrD B-like domain-containing protein, partial [Bacteroidota bacterium]